MHGGGATVEAYSRLVRELADRYRVILPEQRGHGRTADADGPFSYDVMAQDTIAFMKAAGMRSAHFVGHSDGAIVGMLVAMSRPDLVKKFVSIGGNFDVDGYTEEELAFIHTASPEKLRQNPSFANVVETYRQVTPDGPEHFPIVYEKLIRMWRKEPKISPQNLSRIVAPTLVMAGDRDIITLEHTIELFRAIPRARLCILPNSSHFVPIQEPRLVARAILDFLAHAR